MKANTVQLKLRLSPELHGMLKAAATQGSLNAEILRRLTDSFAAPDQEKRMRQIACEEIARAKYVAEPPPYKICSRPTQTHETDWKLTG